MSEPEAPGVTKPRGSMDMDASIWSELRLDLVGHILSFLLLSDVCRNRTVCKAWNQLILSAEFAALHGQHARRRRGPTFIAMNRRHVAGHLVHGEDHDVWCCLDLSARRWYTFDEDRNIGPCVLGVQSMDGGLVCRLRLAPSSLHHSIIVKNLKGLTNVALPEIAQDLNSRGTPELLMVEDNTAFKIFLIDDNYFGSEILDDSLLTSEKHLKVMFDPLIHVYDSVTCEWKNIVNTSWIIERCGRGRIISIVMYKGFLYVVYLVSEYQEDLSRVWRLLRYNLTVESWEYVDGRTYRSITSSLVVSNDCLFLVLWWKEKRSDPDRWFFEVREIRTRDMTQEKVFRLSAVDVMASFDIEAGPPFRSKSFGRILRLIGISVIGFESSLFFISQSSGKSKLFDLVTRSWDHGLPSNPLGHGPWIGKHMNLLLPWNTDW